LTLHQKGFSCNRWSTARPLLNWRERNFRAPILLGA
jgi:hypothetical protein